MKGNPPATSLQQGARGREGRRAAADPEPRKLPKALAQLGMWGIGAGA